MIQLNSNQWYVMILSDLMKLVDYFKPNIPEAEELPQSMSAQKILADFLSKFKSKLLLEFKDWEISKCWIENQNTGCQRLVMLMSLCSFEH